LGVPCPKVGVDGKVQETAAPPTIEARTADDPS
jgi:hypothetical protein